MLGKISSFYGPLSTVSKRVSVDPDAQAFITAAGITDITQQTAINTLVVDLKGYSIWTKMKSIYPMVGGTATTHKFNLKNPLDTDASFRIQFFGGWIHSSTGATPNGFAFANTYLIQSTEYSTDDDIHMSYYSRTDVESNTIEIGCYDGTRACQIGLRNATFNPRINRAWLNNLTESTHSVTSSLGYYLINRSGTSVKQFTNGVVQTTATNSANGRTTVSFYIGAQNFSGSQNLRSKKQCAFATVGLGLSDTEVSNLYVSIQAFQTTLSRQV